jgi:hypothetical protein
VSALKLKLIEEAFEARDAAPKDLEAELADLLEVVDALCRAADINRADLERVREKKRQQRGGFEDGIVLVETAFKSANTAEDLKNEDSETHSGNGIVRTTKVPALEFAVPGAFDFRQGDEFVEAVHSAVIRLSNREWTIPSPRTVRLNPNVAIDTVEWTIEGQRQGAQLKLRLKIHLGNRQLTLPLEGADSESE